MNNVIYSSIVNPEVLGIVTMRGGKLVKCDKPTVSDAWFVLKCELIKMTRWGMSQGDRLAIYNGTIIRHITIDLPKDKLGNRPEVGWQHRGSVHSINSEMLDELMNGKLGFPITIRVVRGSDFASETPSPREKRRLDAAVVKYVESLNRETCNG